jgi:DNA repair exonuclease SbcCD nuclease subunit
MCPMRTRNPILIRPPSPIVAISCADIHLSIRPPIARAEEPNWFAAMTRPWKEIKNLAHKHDAIILCAGDIFDRWNSPPELINWALETLPLMYAVPGNHDLPNHRPDLAYRSAYGTLVRAERIVELDAVPKRLSNLDVYGRPFGEEIPIPIPTTTGILKVLITHEYLWTNGTGHVGAPEEGRLSKVAQNFADFNCVFSGDNHVGFERQLKNGAFVMNCGSLMRRKSNEANHHPRVGLLRSNGRVESYNLNVDDDLLTQTVSLEQEKMDEEESKEVSTFIEDLSNLEASDLSFREAVIQTMKAKNVSVEVRETILEAMEQ